MKKCTFKPTKLIDPVGSGGTLEIGKIFNGFLTDDGKIFFTDKNSREWLFYPADTCELINDPRLKYSTNKFGNLQVDFNSDISLDNGVTNEHQGVFDCSMELFKSEDGIPELIEWDADIDIVSIGLTFEDKELIDYDGVFELPSQAIHMIRKVGYIVDASFEED